LKHSPAALADRDFDNIGTCHYKGVVFCNAEDGRPTDSFGGTNLVQKSTKHDLATGTIEAEEQRMRLLKDTLKKVWQDEPA
jgi:hypothetical protein